MYTQPYSRRGLGASTQQTVGVVSSGAGATIATMTAAGMVAGPVGALIGAGIALVTVAIEALLNSGCGQTCIVTSDWANQAEEQLQQNVLAYFAVPTPRPVAAQQAALANFDKIWAYLSQQCSAPQLGKAGQNCIGDRQRGSCKWKKKIGRAHV
jgi:hypothetical protein